MLLKAHRLWLVKGIPVKYKADKFGRQCVKCLEYKGYSEYHVHSGCKYGYNTICKVCRLPLSKKQYEGTSLEYRMLARCRSRAKRSDPPLDFNLSEEDILIPERCPVMQTPIRKGSGARSPSVDRIDSSKGYIKGNVRVISSLANSLKSNLTLEELRNLLDYVENTH